MIITVQGTHQAGLAPERATVHMHVSFEGSEAPNVMRALNQQMQAINADLAKLRDVPESPITWFAIDAPATRTWRPWNDQGQIMPIRHEASVRVQVKFQDFAALSAWVSAWAERDGITIQHIEWALTESREAEIKDAVLEGAVTAARERAEKMAKAAGFSSVEFLELADPGMLDSRAHPSSPQGAMMARYAGSTGHEGITVAPEDIEITTDVHAKFKAS